MSSGKILKTPKDIVLFMRIIPAILLPLMLFAASSTPPMPPMSENAGKTNSKQSLKSTLPTECQKLPPMLVVLPPPMQAEMDKCLNAFHFPRPDYKKNFANLFGEEAKITNITTVNDFIRLYKVDFVTKSWLGETTKTVYCNTALTSCIEGKFITKKDRQ